MMSNSKIFFSKLDDLIPNVNPKDKPNTKPIPQDQDENLNDYDDSCPNCNNSLENHTRSEKIQCALSRIRRA